jgi:hypothetical protein
MIAFNVWAFLSFFGNVDSGDSDFVIGLSFFVYLIFVGVVNLILYVIYRISEKKVRNCPACNLKVKDGVTICGNCNFNFKSITEQTLTEDSLDPEPKLNNYSESGIPKLKKNIPIIAVGALVAIWVFGGSLTSSKSSDSSSSSDSYVADNSWIPNGFMQWSDGIAYEFVYKDVPCGSDALCLPIKVVSRDGCPTNLYVELALKDKNNTQYAFTNDTTGALSPNTVALLKLETYDWESFASFQIMKMNCY